METTLPADLLADPAATVLMLDIDGVLAPIVTDPETAAVPEDVLAALEAARETCALVAVVTGRTLASAREIVPLEGLWIGACHGMHIQRPDGSEELDPVAEAARPQLELARTMAQTVGWRHEDKGCSLTLHFRHVATPELTARQMKMQIATVLNPKVVEVTDARMALEIRPKGARTKADAVRLAIADAGTDVRHAVYVGDDTTDIDAFRGLDEAGIDATRVAVASDEVPQALIDAADVVLPGQDAVGGLLARAGGQ